MFVHSDEPIHLSIAIADTIPIGRKPSPSITQSIKGNNLNLPDSFFILASDQSIRYLKGRAIANAVTYTFNRTDPVIWFLHQKK